MRIFWWHFYSKSDLNMRNLLVVFVIHLMLLPFGSTILVSFRKFQVNFEKTLKTWISNRQKWLVAWVVTEHALIHSVSSQPSAKHKTPQTLAVEHCLVHWTKSMWVLKYFHRKSKLNIFFRFDNNFILNCSAISSLSIFSQMLSCAVL